MDIRIGDIVRHYHAPHALWVVTCVDDVRARIVHIADIDDLLDDARGVCMTGSHAPHSLLRVVRHDADYARKIKRARVVGAILS